MKRVTMNLSPADLANVAALVQLQAVRNNTHAVSTALSVASFLSERLSEPGTELLIRHDDGQVDRVLIPELQRGVKQGEFDAAASVQHP